MKAPWSLDALSAPPRTYADPERSVGNVRALFYDGLPWKGNPTRVFAYTGMPAVAPGERVPAMVLVHGGGGSAFIPWVELWVSRGYAAIAMDTCGAISGGGYNDHTRHACGGPPGWGGFDQDEDPIQDQWTYHAVADVILAHSLIRSFPGVEPTAIGLTGISWGGYLSCITAGVDPRFRFVVPVYGCGFLGDNSTWLANFRDMGPARRQAWLERWDPSVYLPDARMPMLWVTGPADLAYPLDSLQKSYRLPRAPRHLCVRVGMIHAHGEPSEHPKEIHVMADAILKQGTPLARITRQGRTGRTVWIAFESDTPIQRAELNVTTDHGDWMKRTWKTLPAELDASARTATATLPPDTTTCYLNLIDSRDLAVSSEHEVLAR